MKRKNKLIQNSRFKVGGTTFIVVNKWYYPEEICYEIRKVTDEPCESFFRNQEYIESVKMQRL